MKVSNNWLQNYFSKALPSPESVDELLVMSAFETEARDTVGDDTIIDVDILPNRAHDCLCHYGIAKELSVLLDIPIKEHSFPIELKIPEITSGKEVQVSIDNSEKCRRYTTRVIENIQIDKSPEWLKNKLHAIGQISRNNIVDATNYIMFDLGNPVHVFDYDKLDGDTKLITVRNAKEGETMTLLGKDEAQLALDESMLVITDGNNKTPLALAGIKGGTTAEVDDNTTNIVLEVANFEPVSTRKSRQKAKIATDSSKRFENELTPEITTEVIEQLTTLILEVAGTEDTKVGPITDEYPSPKNNWQVQVSHHNTNRLLGTELSTNDIEDIFRRFGWQYEPRDDGWIIKPDKKRLDLTIEADIIEEIGRVYGYNNLETKIVTDLSYEPEIDKTTYYTNKIRDILTEQGFTEVMTYTFSKKGDMETANALANDKKALRKNLKKGLSSSLEKNINNAPLFGRKEIKQFEIGTIFTTDGEQLVLGLTSGTKKGYTQKSVTDAIKKLEEELGLDIEYETDQGVTEIPLDPILKQVSLSSEYGDTLTPDPSYEDAVYKPHSEYPFVLRDIAIWVPEDTSKDELQKMIKNEAGELLQRVDLFDEYSPESSDKTSYAFTLVFQSYEKTLSDNEVNEVMQKIEDSLNKKDGVEVR